MPLTKRSHNNLVILKFSTMHTKKLNEKYKIITVFFFSTLRHISMLHLPSAIKRVFIEMPPTHVSETFFLAVVGTCLVFRNLDLLHYCPMVAK